MDIIKSEKILLAFMIAFSAILIQCDEYNYEEHLYNFSIKGKVIDESTKAPVENAEIKIWMADPTEIYEYRYSKDTLVFFTDRNGYYKTEKLCTMKFSVTLEASKDGIYEKKVFDNWGWGNDTIIVDFSLKRTVYDFHLSPAALYFGDNLSSLSIYLLNTGTGLLTWKAKANASWIILNSISGQTSANEFSRIDAQANRGTLSPGNYTSSIEITSNAGTVSLPVFITVN